MNAPSSRARARAIAHPPVEVANPSMLKMDLLAAGFAIAGAVLLSLIR